MFQEILFNYKDNDHRKPLINAKCSALTELYSQLAVGFHRFESNYVQDLYCKWKEVLCLMDSFCRASSCIQHITQMHVIFISFRLWINFLISCRNTSIGHLKGASHRFEQVAILEVLCLYLEDVPVNELGTDKNTNEMIFQIRELGKQPPPRVSKRYWLIKFILSDIP